MDAVKERCCRKAGEHMVAFVTDADDRWRRQFQLKNEENVMVWQFAETGRLPYFVWSGIDGI